MSIEIPKPLEKDVNEFCKLNNITDIDKFILTCFRNGYNIVKYGISPKDNFESQNKPLEIKEITNGKEETDIGPSEKEEPTVKKRTSRVKKTNEVSKEEDKEITTPVKPKKKIRIIKN